MCHLQALAMLPTVALQAKGSKINTTMMTAVQYQDQFEASLTVEI
jgi:hypothetical protein